jgi:hypothetical protein
MGGACGFAPLTWILLTWPSGLLITYMLGHLLEIALLMSNAGRVGDRGGYQVRGRK